MCLLYWPSGECYNNRNCVGTVNTAITSASFTHFLRRYAALVHITSGGIYRHFSRSYLIPAAVFTAT